MVLEEESPMKDPVVRLEMSVESPTKERKRLPFVLGLSLRELVVSTISKLTKLTSVAFEVALAVELLKVNWGKDVPVAEAVAEVSEEVSEAVAVAGVAVAVSLKVFADATTRGVGAKESGVFCAGLAPMGVSVSKSVRSVSTSADCISESGPGSWGTA